MVLIIKGTTGCRHTDNKGWMAYVPVEMNHGDYIITLAENEIAEPGYGKFNLLDMGWNFVAGCDFREGHEYMHIYRDLLHTLEKGTVLVVDELDAKMHPLISQQIIRLFNSPATNPYNAQLIFTTHDTHLLSTKMLRRDQIWFTEKNRSEQTDLYCLTDIVLPDGTKPRNDANYEKNYIAGRYGAVPYIVND